MTKEAFAVLFVVALLLEVGGLTVTILDISRSVRSARRWQNMASTTGETSWDQLENVGGQISQLLGGRQGWRLGGLLAAGTGLVLGTVLNVLGVLDPPV